MGTVPAFSPVDLEIYWSRLISIVDEAAAALVRTSFSTVVRECNDFACVLLDENGYALAQSTISVPGFIGTMPRTLREMLKRVPKDELQPGDILMTNDPWLGTGHLPDFTTALPVFNNGTIVAFACVASHMSDIGGRQWSADATEVYEEGLWIPVVKYYRRGILNEDVHRIIEQNVRHPEQVIGDIHAQIAAVTVMSRKLLEFMKDARLKDLTGLGDSIHRASERMMRKAISEIPSGEYEAETRADGWDEPLVLKVRIKVEGQKVAVDYEGTSPQSSRGINAVYNTTFAWTIYPFKSLLVPHLPNNDGFLRLFDVRAPLGSIVNARPPAAVNARHLLVNLLPGVIYEALAPALPERVPAHPGTLWTIVARRGRSERAQPFTMAMFFNSGVGASESGDGASCMSFPSNISVTPIEIVENLSPLRFSYKVLASDSGGRGRWRGGCGQRIAIESVSDEPVMVSLLTERTRFPAVGLNGGQPGACGFVRKNGHMIDEPKSIITLSRGDVLEFQLPGGGGFGNPDARDNVFLDDDVREGYTSRRISSS